MDPDKEGGDGGIDGYYDYYRTTTTGDRRVGGSTVATPAACIATGPKTRRPLS